MEKIFIAEHGITLILMNEEEWRRAQADKAPSQAPLSEAEQEARRLEYEDWTREGGAQGA